MEQIYYSPQRNRITLTDQPDSLLWAGGDATGSLTVKNIYNAFLQQMNLEVDFSWTRQIWHWQVPLKLKFFTWLAGKQKILTWEALRHRGWEGPGYCPLCKLMLKMYTIYWFIALS